MDEETELGYDDDAPKVRLSIRTVVGLIYFLRCYYSQSILQLKKELEGYTGVPYQYLHIIWRDVELFDYETLEGVGLKENSQVTAIFRIESGPLTTGEHEMMLDLVDVLDKIEDLSLEEEDCASFELDHEELATPLNSADLDTAASKMSDFDSPEMSEENIQLKNKINYLRTCLQKKKKKDSSSASSVLDNSIQELQVPNGNEADESASCASGIPSCSQSSQSLTTPKLPHIRDSLTTVPEKVICSYCRKKIGLCTTYRCRCGYLFCARHRYPEAHECSYDFKEHCTKDHGNSHIHATPKLPKI